MQYRYIYFLLPFTCTLLPQTTDLLEKQLLHNFLRKDVIAAQIGANAKESGLIGSLPQSTQHYSTPQPAIAQVLIDRHAKNDSAELKKQIALSIQHSSNQELLSMFITNEQEAFDLKEQLLKNYKTRNFWLATGALGILATIQLLATCKKRDLTNAEFAVAISLAFTTLMAYDSLKRPIESLKQELIRSHEIINLMGKALAPSRG